MDRGRDRRGFDDRDAGYGGETYRPSDRVRSPPRHSFRDRSPPPRRGRSPYRGGYSSRGGRFDDRARSRTPPRRRSRSPSVRGGGDDRGYRGRARSPPHGAGRPRSPPYRRQSRSPFGARSRPRSPLPPRRDRDRDNTPPGNYRRSPAPKPGRFTENRDRDDYGARRPYERDEPKRFPYENNYRPRERSRTPPPRVSAHTSRGASPDSRHSGSGSMHPDRMDRVERVPDRPRRGASPPFRSPREPISDHRSSGYHSRDRSPPPRRAYSPPARSPPRQEASWRERERERTPPLARDRDRDRDRAPPPRARESPREDATPSSWSNEQMSTPRFQNGDSRAPPTGPRERYNSDYNRDAPPSGPPTGPSMINHSRGSILSAPTRPSRDPGFRGGRGRGHFSGPPTPRTSTYDRDPGAPPTGPRNSISHAQAHSPPARFDSGPPSASRYDSDATRYPSGPRYPSSPRGGHPSYDHAPLPTRGSRDYDFPPTSGRGAHGPPFRSNNSTSTTYPRTQRFNHPHPSSNNNTSHASNAVSVHLASVAALAESGAGKKFPSGLEPGQEKRLAQLEDEKRKLEEQIGVKEERKRHALREWDRVDREAKREAFKGALADEHLAKLSGEVGGAAY